MTYVCLCHASVTFFCVLFLVLNTRLICLVAEKFVKRAESDSGSEFSNCHPFSERFAWMGRLSLILSMRA